MPITGSRLLDKMLHLVLLLWCLPLARDDHQRMDRLAQCSRPQAAVVRQLVNKLWRPIFRRLNASVPLECPLHPSRDVFWPQESAKTFYRSDFWMCSLCQKVFPQHIFLDLHLARRHHEQIYAGDDAVCLADYCDVFRCHGYLPRNSTLSRPELESLRDIAQYEALYPDLRVPSDGAAAENALIPAPPKGVPDDEYLTLVTTEEVECGADDCDHSDEAAVDSEDGLDTRPRRTQARAKRKAGARLRRTDTKRRTLRDEVASLFRSLTAARDGGDDYAADDELSEVWKPPKDYNASCQPEHMQLLKRKCEDLIFTCISPIRLDLSDSDYELLQSRLHSSVCSYLSCDKYWRLLVASEGANRLSATTAALFAAVLAAVVAFVAVAYYIVWVCF